MYTKELDITDITPINGQKKMVAWGYNLYKWPKINVELELQAPINEVITLLITGRGPPGSQSSKWQRLRGCFGSTKYVVKMDKHGLHSQN